MSPAFAIVGATASGKSALAMTLARQRPEAEIVSVDSMQVYREMDIGTAKPTPAERAEVPHHLLDIADPGDEFTVAEFQQAARHARADIAQRAGTALLVGGTGLYHRAVVDELDIPARYPRTAAQLAAEPDTTALHRRLVKLDPVAAERMQPTNRRRVLRALEVTLGSGRPFSSYGPGLSVYPDNEVLQVGIAMPRPLLDTRIQQRFERQMADGFLDEVQRLASRGRPLSATAAQALGYKELLTHLDGAMGLEEAVQVAMTRTRRFARRQQRWFQRDPRIRWLDGTRPVAELSGELLALYDAHICGRAMS